MLEWRLWLGKSLEGRKICRGYSRGFISDDRQQWRDQRRIARCSGRLPMQGWLVDLPLDVFFKLQLVRNGFISAGGRNLEIPETLCCKRKLPARFDFWRGKGAFGSSDYFVF